MLFFRALSLDFTVALITGGFRSPPLPILSSWKTPGRERPPADSPVVV